MDLMALLFRCYGGGFFRSFLLAKTSQSGIAEIIEYSRRKPLPRTPRAAWLTTHTLLECRHAGIDVSLERNPAEHLLSQLEQGSCRGWRLKISVKPKSELVIFP